MSAYVDADDDAAGIYLHPSIGAVRFLSFDDNGSNILADIELSPADVEHIRDTLTNWLEQR